MLNSWVATRSLTATFQRILWVVALSYLGTRAALAEDSPLFHFSATQGPFQVGLKVVEQYDYSRSFHEVTDALGQPYKGERARPLQTLIWYPAGRGGGHPMTVSDYLELWATETTFDHRNPPVMAEWRAGMKPTLGMSLWAVRDAPAASGRFPIVIYAPSFSHVAWENADLCEYLASHGYVVIASPDMGATTRSMTLDLTGINAQARDISFLIAYAGTLANADSSRLAVAGYSWGGISNLFAAARDNRIRALVALDGSMRYYPGLVKQAGDVHAEQMSLPLLFFAQRDFSLEDQARYMSEGQINNPSVLNAWTHGDLLYVHMLGLSHGEFSSMHQRNENMWWELFNVWPVSQGDYDREDAMTAYGWVARYTLAFLDAYLKEDAGAVGFLKRTPAENGVPRHVMASNYRTADDTPATFESFRAELGQRGFDHAEEVYITFRKKKSDFAPSEPELSSWAQELIEADYLPQAIAILKLAAQIYPTSSDRYVDLGDAYLRFGQKHLALESYRTSLEKDATNGAARRKLTILQEPVDYRGK